ncbi:anti-repressor SinI family protein [Bacillus sp. V3B]|nr:anti-repressor SinI family protein [Bacillus sp. V3B]MCQ6275200.1 anti-repressor SinI family protein [Bacillus sp. V3B]
MVEKKEKNKGFDIEWIQLILEAKNLGIKKEEIQTFLQRETVIDRVIID